jgi:hypothetical protein
MRDTVVRCGHPPDPHALPLFTVLPRETVWKIKTGLVLEFNESKQIGTNKLY